MAYLDTFGWLLYKKGNFAEARKWLERAGAAGTPKDPVVMDHLGDACWRMSDREAAVRHWEQSRELLRELPQETPNSDERRVRNTVERKIEDARADREPAVAALAAPAPAPKE
jgi:Tfp pilus assembly protein PilF